MTEGDAGGRAGGSRLLILLLLAGLLARVLYLGQVAALPFFQDPVGDSARYLERAREVLDGDVVGQRPFFYGGIFYPYLLALTFVVFGPSLYPICLLQAVAGAALAWILHRFASAAVTPGERASSRVLGLTAATIALFYGPFAFLEADILMISWTLLLTMTGALLLLEAIGARGRVPALARFAAAGCCLGLAASERPNLILLLPALAVWAWGCRSAASGLPGAAALLGGGALVLLSVAALNHAACGRWVLLTTSSGINFYIGNHEGARGTFDEPWAESDPEFTASRTDLEESSLAMARQISGRDLDAVAASRFWFARGLDYLGQDPSGAARLYLRKLTLFWNDAEVPNHLHFSFLRSTAPALWLMPLTFGLVAPLGLYGLVAPRARGLLARPAIWLLAILILVPMATVLPFFVADRYRVTVVPPLIVAAACGLVRLGRMLRTRPARRVGSIHLACVALVGVAMARPATRFGLERDHWLMAQAFDKQGSLHAAVHHYERAVEASPGDAALRNNLAEALRRTGQADRAEAELRRAVELRPELLLPHRNLGLILMRHGPARAHEAFEHLLVAERARPDDLEVARAMAALHLARGDRDGARERALKVLASAPGDPGARAVLQAAGGP